MNREQEAFLGMCLKVKNFGVRNTTALAVYPSIPPVFTQQAAMLAILLSADEGARADLTGYAMDKANKRKTLETASLKVSNAIAAYAVVNNNIILQKRADFATSFWYSCSEEELITQASILRDLAAPLTSAIITYGASATDVTNQGIALTTFIDVVSNPSLAIDQRKIDNTHVEDAIDQLRTLHDTKLDVLMRAYELNNPTLYSLYLNARAIDINGSILAPTVVATADPSSTKSIYAQEYNGNTLYTLQNMGIQSVFFSLSDDENTDGPQLIDLPAGETRQRLGYNMATTGKFLVITNTSSVPIEVKLWVE